MQERAEGHFRLPAIYLFDAANRARLHLQAALRLPAGHPACPAEVSLDTAPWPMQAALLRRRGLLHPLAAGELPALPGGVWKESPQQVMVFAPWRARASIRWACFVHGHQCAPISGR